MGINQRMQQDILGMAEKIAELEESDLFDAAIAELDGQSFQKGGDDDHKRSRLDKWINDHRTILHDLLCKPKLVILLDPPETAKEKVLIITAVADCITGSVIGLSPLTASALVVNYGVRRLCGSNS